MILDTPTAPLKVIDDALMASGRFQSLGRTTCWLKAWELITTHQPKLLFLNIDGAFEDAFKLVAQLPCQSCPLPVCIALSKDTQLAYQTIKHGFSDYLLTPVVKCELHGCLARCMTPQNPKGLAPVICLKSYTDFQFLKPKDIVLLKADNNTTDFQLCNGTLITAYKTLKTFERGLPDAFKRIHKSYIINLHYLQRIDFGKQQCRIQHVAQPIPFSKKYLETMKTILTAYPKIML